MSDYLMQHLLDGFIALIVAVVAAIVTKRLTLPKQICVVIICAAAAFAIAARVHSPARADEPTTNNNGVISKPSVKASPSGDIDSKDNDCTVNNTGNGSTSTATCGTAPSKPKPVITRRKSAPR